MVSQFKLNIMEISFEIEWEKIYRVGPRCLDNLYQNAKGFDFFLMFFVSNIILSSK
jgi:hypothetical protein